MSHLIKKTTIAAGVVLTMSLPAQAADNLTVDGYAKNSSGETWTDSSGDCVRTTYKDTKELIGACGYETVVKDEVKVDNQPAGVGVAVVEETQVMEKGRVLADKKQIVVETFVENLQFGFDSADLTAADRAALDSVITKLDPFRPLLRDNVAQINVIGYTDSVGPAAYNQKLSERRAQSVHDYLANPGNVRPEVMQVKGMGEADPIGDNATDAGRQLNRRVVIEVFKR
jgi:OOP family OmpA-OmpF porin